VEDRFQRPQLVEDGQQGRVGGEEGLARGHASIVGAID
jgi:hypothetical protein